VASAKPLSFGLSRAREALVNRFRNILAATLVLAGAAADSAAAQKSARPRPSGAPRPAGAPAPATAPPAAPAAPPAAVTRQAAAPGAANATAGMAIAPFEGDEDARPAYLRSFTQQLDSAISLLVGVFRNTSGQPMAGAEAPTALSQRERDRWVSCRNLHWDLQSYASAMHDQVEFDNASVSRAAAALDSALTALQATSECDNVASMIAAPARWAPWESNYQTSARNFYGSWYTQLYEVADRNRAFVIAYNLTLPAAQRIPVPPAMPRNPPYAGASPR
jgi:hypothetical protein